MDNKKTLDFLPKHTCIDCLVTFNSGYAGNNPRCFTCINIKKIGKPKPVFNDCSMCGKTLDIGKYIGKVFKCYNCR